MKLRLAGMQNESIVDGPGIRLALYVQGCPHRCPGCHNPETHDPNGGWETDTCEVISIIDHNTRRDGSYTIDGVTVSGGEPFEQAAPLALLAAEIAGRGLNLVLYSGYTFEQLLERSLVEQEVRILLETGWLLVDGPFIESRRDLCLSYRGSSNQRLVDLDPSLTEGKAVEWDGCMGSSAEDGLVG